MTVMQPLTLEGQAMAIKNATNLYDLHKALICFENLVDRRKDDTDNETELDKFGINIAELPRFGPEPKNTIEVWSWDEDSLLVGTGPFCEWSIIDRNEQPNPSGGR